MKDGFLTCGTISPTIRVADPVFNTASIKKAIDKAREARLALLVLPELAVTGYTAADLFLQRTLQEGAKVAVEDLVSYSKGSDMVVVVGSPLIFFGNLYNCAVVMQSGRVLGVVPKRHVPNYQEFQEKRWFHLPPQDVREVSLAGQKTLFGTNLLFSCADIPEFVLGVEVCEDLWVAESPSTDMALAGATVIANCSASDELVGKQEFRRTLITAHSAKLVCGYLYCSAGPGESTTDLVFAAHNLIYENGKLLGEQFLQEDTLLLSEVDVQRLGGERLRMHTFGESRNTYARVEFTLKELHETVLTRFIDKSPFVPADPVLRAERCEKILTLQALGLKKRLEHTSIKQVVLGLSGGLDSTLALLVCIRAFEMLNLDRLGIIAVTMPCFGTTKRTKDNASSLAKAFGVTLLTIPIAKAVTQHFKDIGHDPEVHDVTYENSQARERTQVLMDLANKHSALVIGTGDLSELALGWATYNGDHMSMYGVNSSVPKTLVRHLVAHFAHKEEGKIQKVLLDVVATPVSPELLPASLDGTISQVTEEVVGPYALHDFFLYQVVRLHFGPAKVLRLALLAFEGEYDGAIIRRWLKTFYRRFFSQQFKRSCLPDGPKVGSVSLSPRGDWRMPSDASARLWMDELEGL
ncbi:MAG TPA: NAD(+) synthase [Spirochaetales bacterium]|nr:NAD(+) synthase [Spirochaetales bacterium]